MYSCLLLNFGLIREIHPRISDDVEGIDGHWLMLASCALAIDVDTSRLCFLDLVEINCRLVVRILRFRLVGDATALHLAHSCRIEAMLADLTHALLRVDLAPPTMPRLTGVVVAGNFTFGLL